MNFWQHCTFLSARVPRVKCPEHGVKEVEVPRGRKGGGFSLLLRRLSWQWWRRCRWRRWRRWFGEHYTRLWRIIRHSVEEAHARSDWSGVEAVALDETSRRKGQGYATVAVEPDLKGEKPARLLYMTPERTAEKVGEFVAEMPAQGAGAEQVKVAAIDMSAAYQKGVAEHLPAAKIVFDRYHVMQLAGGAVDEVQMTLSRAGHDMKGALWALVRQLRSSERGTTADAGRAAAEGAGAGDGVEGELGGDVGMAREGEGGGVFEGMGKLGGAKAPGALQRTGANNKETLGGNSLLLPRESHFCSGRGDQRDDSNSAATGVGGGVAISRTFVPSATGWQEGLT